MLANLWRSVCVCAAPIEAVSAVIVTVTCHGSRHCLFDWWYQSYCQYCPKAAQDMQMAPLLAVTTVGFWNPPPPPAAPLSTSPFHPHSIPSLPAPAGASFYKCAPPSHASFPQCQLSATTDFWSSYYQRSNIQTVTVTTGVPANARYPLGVA